MRKVVVNTFLTLDGVMQAPGGPEEDPTGGFEHGGWSVGYWDDMMGERMGATLDVPFELILGRKTYEIFAAHWPHTDEPGAEPLNRAHKHVASRTLEEPLEWSNSTLLGDHVPQAVVDLKAGDGPDLQVHGSADLLQTLLRHGLIDEFRLWVFPVVLGSGKQLFGDGAIPAGLRLTDSATSTTGVVIATYKPSGEIAYGSFALEELTEAEAERRRRLADD